MGARVGIFDADVYGPSLPTMVSPEAAVLGMDPVTKQITPTEYEGVKLVSFGFAGQGSAIMRGAMVSGMTPATYTFEASYIESRHQLLALVPLYGKSRTEIGRGSFISYYL